MWLVASICKYIYIYIYIYMDMGTLTCLFGSVVVW